jgi:hypothetical protein
VVDRDGLVLLVKTIKPWTGGTRFRLRASATVEAAAGAMAAWQVAAGSVLAIGNGQ